MPTLLEQSKRVPARAVADGRVDPTSRAERAGFAGRLAFARRTCRPYLRERRSEGDGPAVTTGVVVSDHLRATRRAGAKTSKAPRARLVALRLRHEFRHLVALSPERVKTGAQRRLDRN